MHIVCLDAPSPPDYGGVFDLYYKIIALSEAGVKIILHYFDYKQGRDAYGLEKYCSHIYNYRRKSFISSMPFVRPYIVESRVNKHLITRLNEDNFPIIIEGIHCTGIIPHINTKQRKIIVRVHNDEAAYYTHLSFSERSYIKKQYLKREGRLLKKYQENLDPSLDYAFVSAADKNCFEEKYKFRKTHFIPAFLPWQAIEAAPGVGSYCLYQGNLGVSENEKATLWLMENIFSFSKIPFVIAGKNIPERIQMFVNKLPHLRIINNPEKEDMAKIIREAQIHLLPSFNNTGIKLKLLHALICGRFCITNRAGIEGSGITKGIFIANHAKEFRTMIEQLMLMPFSIKDIEERKYLLELFNNKTNAEKLSALLW